MKTKKNEKWIDRNEYYIKTNVLTFVVIVAIAYFCYWILLLAEFAYM